MELIVLGCNGPYPAKDSATAGYLLKTNEGRVALDMGSGVFSRLQTYCQPEKISAVVLSHLHHDHISDMGVFNYYLELLSKKGLFQGRIPCYVPPVEEGLSLLEKQYPYFRFIGVKEGASYVFAGGNAEFYKLKHGALNYGLRFTEGNSGKKFVYSGDTNVCPNLEKMLFGCDFWLGSAPFIGEEYSIEGGHLSVEVMQALSLRYNVKTLLSHLSPLRAVSDYERASQSELLQIAQAFQTYQV